MEPTTDCSPRPAVGATPTALGCAAIAAGYTSFAELINANFGRTVLPEFPMMAMRQTHPVSH